MARSNRLLIDFKEGDRVRVIDACTAPARLGEIGVVRKTDAKYPHRVAVRFCSDRDFHDVFFHPSELEVVEE